MVSNRSGIGSFFKILQDNGRKIYRTINTGGSFGSSSLQSEIGLGNCKSIKKISINWPSGKIQVFTNLEPNKKYEIFENNNNPYQSQFNKLLFAKNFNHSHHQPQKQKPNRQMDNERMKTPQKIN